jgi:hypothetical protein
MVESDWRGGKQEKLQLYWKVREERKQVLREKYERLKPHLGERGKRLWATYLVDLCGRDDSFKRKTSAGASRLVGTPS